MTELLSTEEGSQNLAEQMSTQTATQAMERSKRKAAEPRADLY